MPNKSCKVCSYVKKHPRCDIDIRLATGATAAEISREYGIGYDIVRRHAGRIPHKDGTPNTPHWSRQLAQAAVSREAKKGLDLVACQKEVYDLSIRGAKIALGDLKSNNRDVKPDIRAFGGCLSGAAKIVEVIAKASPDSNDDVESDGLVEVLKAIAKNDWKKARALQMETTESETANGDELDIT